MSLRRSSDPGSIGISQTACWQDWWDSVLRLATEDFSQDRAYIDALQITQLSRSFITDEGRRCFEQELDDAQQFVIEQCALDPSDAHWRRIEAVLAGARAGLA